MTSTTPLNFKMQDSPDPIIMYLIVRESLSMGMGKTAAQVGHAVQMLHTKYNKLTNWIEHAQGEWEVYGDINSEGPGIEQEEINQCEIYKNWLNSNYRKVVLKADDKEFEKLKLLSNYVIVVDNGLTEVPSGSETCIGFYPMFKSEAQKTLIKKLQTLK